MLKNRNIALSLKQNLRIMQRREFLESIGIGAAFVLTASCLQSCKHEPIVPPTNNATGGGVVPTPTNFIIDLDDPTNAALKTNGGYVVTRSVVIAKDVNGNYVAATQICSHAGRAQVYFNSSNEFYCSAHGARFSTDGIGLNSAAQAGLKIYKTAIEGHFLRIFLS
jgi:nitrite reductase/ring-hydroxylating ferredoxin subunit